MTGVTGIVGLLACLLRAQRRRGKGCDVDTCLFDVAMHQLSYPGDLVPERGRRLARACRAARIFAVAPVQTFPTADGWIFIMCMTDKFWTVAGRGARPAGPAARSALRRRRHARRQNRAALTEALDADLRARAPTREWLASLHRPAAGRAGLRRWTQALDSALRARRPAWSRDVPHPAKRGLARARQPDQDRRRAAGAGRLLAARRRQRRAAGAGERSMKLEGLKVVDLSWFLPGPYLTMALADHGAEVIKVEPPARAIPAATSARRTGARTVFFRNLNRGKKSVVLDLKSEQGRDAICLRLAATTPTCSSRSFRPGVADRLRRRLRGGAARATRGIVYCSISAFGQDGAYRRPRRARSRARGHDRRAEPDARRRRPAGDPRHPDRRPGERRCRASPAC